MKRILCLLSVIYISGCASKYIEPPSSAFIDALPIVKFGGEKPKDNEFIIFYPKEVEIPFTVKINGSIFREGVEISPMITLKNDIYTYKTWFSYDRKSWVYLTDFFDHYFSIGRDLSGGLVKIKLNEQ